MMRRTFVALGVLAVVATSVGWQCQPPGPPPTTTAPSTTGAPTSTSTSTSTSTTSTAAPTTTAPATTTSSPTSTTVESTSAPTTTAPVTSTSAPAPTTTAPPPSGVQFFEDFTSDQRARFDWRLQTTQEPPQGSFQGEHNMACEGPTTHRTINQLPLQWGVPHSNIDVTNSEFVWWCAPGNDTAKGHMMTGLDTASIATLSFSPKQVFNNVTRVCWKQNMNNLGEGKWINVYVVPNADVVAHGGDLAYADGVGIPNGGIPQMLPPGAFDFDWIRGSISMFKIGPSGSYDQVGYYWKSSVPEGMATESASRFQICLDSAAGTVRLQRPNGAVDTYPLGGTFPTGPVRVIFQDASYNPAKHGEPTGAFTWHWDDITIS